MLRRSPGKHYKRSDLIAGEIGPLCGFEHQFFAQETIGDQGKLVITQSIERQTAQAAANRIANDQRTGQHRNTNGNPAREATLLRQKNDQLSQANRQAERTYRVAGKVAMVRLQISEVRLQISSDVDANPQHLPCPSSSLLSPRPRPRGRG